MALEDLTGTDKFISALNPTWPTDDDWVDEGDNHLRGIKNILKNTFPNVDGAVTLTDEQLNRVTVATPDSRIINGNFAIDQRTAGAETLLPFSSFVTDRWDFSVDANEIRGGRKVLTPGSYYLMAKAAVAVSAAPAKECRIRQVIEGLNLADLQYGTANALPLTLSFEVRATIAGTGTISIRGATPLQYYVRTFPVTTNFTTVTVTVPGATTGTWEVGNGVGFYVDWGIAIGSDHAAPAASTAWAVGTFDSVAGATNFMATIGNEYHLRNVRLYPGSIDYGPCQRLYADELRLCQRYYEKSYDIGTVPGTASFVGAEAIRIWAASVGVFGTVPFKEMKRSAPTITAYNPTTGAAGSWRFSSAGTNPAVTVNSSNETKWAYDVAAGSVNDFLAGHWTASAEL